ncbi:hypothetical protein E2C01_073466 [Portunus trituberculatus]|uniref:Uncharacterized protein n=1 Tax=Portunus trituberculatus TaxID=210409 RepID=A0A5B7IBS0_PORTR|nr:hypothetical protein [Portunus trituberculatus]
MQPAHTCLTPASLSTHLWRHTFLRCLPACLPAFPHSLLRPPYCVHTCLGLVSDFATSAPLALIN